MEEYEKKHDHAVSEKETDRIVWRILCYDERRI